MVCECWTLKLQHSSPCGICSAVPLTANTCDACCHAAQCFLSMLRYCTMCVMLCCFVTGAVEGIA
jgi:hypothetical protein